MEDIMIQTSRPRRTFPGRSAAVSAGDGVDLRAETGEIARCGIGHPMTRSSRRPA
jgi:hypothetical protein